MLALQVACTHGARRCEPFCFGWAGVVMVVVMHATHVALVALRCSNCGLALANVLSLLRAIRFDYVTVLFTSSTPSRARFVSTSGLGVYQS